MFDPALRKMGCCIKIWIKFSQNGSKLEHPSINHLKLQSLFCVLSVERWLNHNLCRVDKSSQTQFMHMAYNNYSPKIANENHYIIIINVNVIYDSYAWLSLRFQVARYYTTILQQIHVSIEGIKQLQGCALAEPGGPWRPTFALGRLENLRFFKQIICWAP